MARSFRSTQAATLLEFHVPFTNCFVCRWFCVVHDPKPPLHRQNWLSFGKFQDTECFLIHYQRHFSSRLPPSGGTCKYAKAPSTKKKLGEILYLLICSFLPCLSWLLRSRVQKSRRDLWITLYSTQSLFLTGLSRRAQSGRWSFRETGVVHRITYSFNYFFFTCCFIYSVYCCYKIM